MVLLVAIDDLLDGVNRSGVLRPRSLNRFLQPVPWPAGIRDNMSKLLSALLMLTSLSLISERLRLTLPALYQNNLMRKQTKLFIDTDVGFTVLCCNSKELCAILYNVKYLNYKMHIPVSLARSNLVRKQAGPGRNPVSHINVR